MRVYLQPNKQRIKILAKCDKKSVLCWKCRAANQGTNNQRRSFQSPTRSTSEQNASGCCSLCRCLSVVPSVRRSFRKWKKGNHLSALKADPLLGSAAASLVLGVVGGGWWSKVLSASWWVGSWVIETTGLWAR